MHRRVKNTGDPKQDWIDEGPCSPIPCGPGGERHTTQSNVGEVNWAPSTYGTVIPMKGKRPFQFPVNAAIEVNYGD